MGTRKERLRQRIARRSRRLRFQPKRDPDIACTLAGIHPLSVELQTLVPVQSWPGPGGSGPHWAEARSLAAGYVGS